MRWLLAVMVCMMLGGAGLFSHANNCAEGSPSRTDTTDTSIVNPPDTTDTTIVNPPDTTDTTIVNPPDTTDTTVVIPPDTTDTTVVIPPDTTDTTVVIPPDTITPPLPDFKIDSLLLYIPDSGTFKIPAVFKEIDPKRHYVQVGDGLEAAIDTATVGWVTIPDTVILDSVKCAVKCIGVNAFRECKGIMKLELPSIVESVGDYAFYGDTSLGHMIWDKDSSLLLNIGTAAFAGSGLREVDLPHKVVELYPSSFAACDSLLSVTFGDSLLMIGRSSFRDCRSLASLSFSESVYRMGTNVFQGCESLTEVQLPPFLKSLADSAFAQCTGLTSVTFGDSLLTIGRSSFKDCRSLATISFPEGLRGMGTSAFQGCESLTEVQLPSSLTTLADSAFAQCTALTTATLNPELRTIGRSSFKDCISLALMSFPDSLWQIGAKAFAGCESMAYVVFPDSLLAVGDSAFSGCEQLASLQFNMKLRELGDGAFQDCPQLDSVVLPDGLTSLGARAFQRCLGLRFFVSNDSLRAMGDNVLEGDTNLYYVDLRRSRQLPIQSASREDGMLGGIMERVLVYTPNGSDKALGINIINTVANMVTYTEGLNVDGEELPFERSREGEGTYLLNKYYGSDLFGQMLGEPRHDNCPLPYEERPMPVFRLRFSVNGALRFTKYVNYGKTQSLPSASDLGYVAGAQTCVYTDADGVEQEFTDSTAVYCDMDIDVTLAHAPGDANYDGKIDVLDVTTIINYILGLNTESFVFESADMNGDGSVDVMDVTSVINRILTGDTDEATRPKTLKVLCIGNSYTCDAFSYVPFVMRNIAPQVQFTLGMLHKSASTLQTHYEECFDSCGVYPFFYKYNVSGNWKCYRLYTLEQALKSDKWDVVIMQQGSTDSRDYSLYQPYLDYMMAYLDSALNTTYKTGWMLIPAYPDGQELLENSTSNDMFYDIAACTDSVMTLTGMDFLIPCGTAIQNARTTELDRLGYWGHLSYEGRHLQDGIPCLIESYTVAQVLLDQLGVRASIDDDFLNVTDTWLVEKDIPQVAGSSAGMTPTNRELAKYCAKMAIQNPYVITDCSNFINWVNEAKLKDNRKKLQIDE